MKKQYALFAALGIILLPSFALAHQPRIVTSATTTVVQPEVSKAYYAQLMGEPQDYVIHADKPFALYVNVLVPDIAGQKKDISAAILKDGNTDKPLAVLGGLDFQWKKFFEPFGHDTYWMGPEYRANVGPGNYIIHVWSSNNDSKYSVAIGETEVFDVKEGLNAIRVIPQIKRNFFNESPLNFILSPFGWGYVLVLYVVATLVGLALRFGVKLATKGTFYKNVGHTGRLVRVALAAVLLAVAITTSWNVILLLASGYILFEAIFGWSGANWRK